MMSPWSSSTPLTEAAEWVQLLFCVFGLKKKKPAVSQLQIAHDFISLISGVSGPVPASRLWCGLPLRAVPLWYQHMLEDPCCLPKISLQTSLEGGKEKNIKDTKIQCWKKKPKKKLEYEPPACAYKSHCHYNKIAVPQIRQSVTVPYKTCPWCWSQPLSPRDIKQAFAACWCSLTWHIASGDSVLLRRWAVSYNLNTSSSSWIVFIEKLAHC